MYGVTVMAFSADRMQKHGETITYHRENQFALDNQRWVMICDNYTFLFDIYFQRVTSWPGRRVHLSHYHQRMSAKLFVHIECDNVERGLEPMTTDAPARSSRRLPCY